MCVLTQCHSYLSLDNKHGGFKQPPFHSPIILWTNRASAGQFFYCSHFKASCVCCQMATGDRTSKVAPLTRQEPGQCLGTVTSLSLHTASWSFLTCQVDFKSKCSKTTSIMQALTKFLLACHTC